MISRRRIVVAGLLLPVSRALAQTCGVVTPRQTEGPFFKPQSPRRISLMDGKSATLVVTGQVLSRECKPLANALLDFWHADEEGNYDNDGFRHRGHQFTDAQGRFRLETVRPTMYPGRTAHIHVKVQPPGGRILTTQLYFPNEPGNSRDGLFRRELVIDMKTRREGSFDFVLS